VPRKASRCIHFRIHTAPAQVLSNALLDANPNNVDALYGRGVTRSLQATYLGLGDKAWFGALRSALNARQDHERVLQLAPRYTDAELVVGIHEYVVGSLPWWFKTGVSVFGVRGSKSRGIEDLYIAANGGGETAVNPCIALALFLRREHSYAEALPLVGTLIKSYPRNFLFALEEANLLNVLGQRQEAAAVYRKLEISARVYPNARPELAWYGLGESLQGQQEYGEAEAAYERVLEYSRPSPDLRRRASDRASEMRAHSRKTQQVPTHIPAPIGAGEPVVMECFRNQTNLHLEPETKRIVDRRRRRSCFVGPAIRSTAGI
jgi:tetratricopeptide (TPR) repeat protein